MATNTNVASSTYGINSLTKMAMLKLHNVQYQESANDVGTPPDPNDPKYRYGAVNYQADLKKWEEKAKGTVTDVNSTLLKAWAKGDMDISSLKDLKFSYKEYLRSSNSEMNKVFDNLTVGLRNKLNTYTKKLGKLASGTASKGDAKSITEDSGGVDGTDGGGSSKTEAAVLDFAAAMATLLGNDELDVATIYSEMVGYVQRFNVPVRTQNPSIQIPIDGNIKINFAWGKAGLFNAKKEVWDPIQTIIGALKPSLREDPQWPGLLKFEGMNTIPYNNQTKFIALKGAILDGPLSSKDSIKSVSKEVNNLTKELANSGMQDIMSTKKVEDAQKKLNGTKREGVIRILKNIALLNPTMLSIASTKLRNTIQDSMYMLCLAFQPTSAKNGTIMFNIDTLTDGCGTGSSEPLYYPLITLYGVPEEIEWGFDYSQPDENGYPMAGYINIKKIWAVDAFGQNFSVDTDVNKKYLKKLLTPKGFAIDENGKPNNKED